MRSHGKHWPSLILLLEHLELFRPGLLDINKTATFPRYCVLRMHHIPTWILGERRLLASVLSWKTCGISLLPRPFLQCLLSYVLHRRHNGTNSSTGVALIIVWGSEAVIDGFNQLRPGIPDLFLVLACLPSTYYKPSLHSMVVVWVPDPLTSWSTHLCLNSSQRCLLKIDSLPMWTVRMYDRRHWRVHGIDRLSSIRCSRSSRSSSWKLLPTELSSLDCRAWHSSSSSSALVKMLHPQICAETIFKSDGSQFFSNQLVQATMNYDL